MTVLARYSASTFERPERLNEGFGAGVRAATPVVLGYLPIGFAFGVLARTGGLSVLEIALMSLLVYAGSAQFIGAGMLAAGDPAAAIVSTTFLVNLRHLLMSAALSPSYRGLPAWVNSLLGYELTDETFAVASAHLQGRLADPRWVAGLNLTSQFTWILASVAGGVFGDVIPDTGRWGLDFALPAMFVALLVLQLGPDRSGKKYRTRVQVALASALLAVIFGLIIPGRWNVILATVLAAALGVWLER